METNKKKLLLINLIGKIEDIKDKDIMTKIAITSFKTSLKTNRLIPKDNFLKAIHIIESMSPFINMTREEILDFLEPIVTDRKNITKQNFYFQ